MTQGGQTISNVRAIGEARTTKARKGMVLQQTLPACIVGLHGTVRDALKSLDVSCAGIVIVTNEAGRVVGLLTDGDLRRALLGGASLEGNVQPHMKTTFTHVSPAVGRSDVLDLMQARSISEVPILDEEGRLVGLHRMHDVVAPVHRPNWAVIMAGGRGTRLAPLTDTVPKPMLRIAGRPILERILLHLVGSGISRIYISINYLGHIVEEHFGDGSHFGCHIEYLREDKPLGTCGPLSLLPERPTHPLLVMNGDLVTQTDLGALLSHHERTRAAVTLGARQYLHTVPFGCLELDGSRVLSIEEKPTLSRAINAGIYVLDPSVLDLVPKDRDYTMPALLEDVMGTKRLVTAFEIEGDWIDVGQRDQLKHARGEGP